MANPPTNIQVIKASRKQPMSGDVFAIRLPDGSHVFGRVIDADIHDPKRAPMPGSYLIYVYQLRSASIEPEMSELTPDRLLLPPIFINKMPWTKGYFATVGHADPTGADRLRRHCFWRAVSRIYVDENRNSLARKIHPCGDWALSSYRWLDDQISDALGIPRVLEDI